MTNSTAWHEHEPTPEQIAQTQHVEKAICHEVNLLAREGVPVPILIAGMGTAIADLLTCTHGPESVAKWFAAQAKMITDLQKPN